MLKCLTVKYEALKAIKIKANNPRNALFCPKTRYLQTFQQFTCSQPLFQRIMKKITFLGHLQWKRRGAFYFCEKALKDEIFLKKCKNE